MQGKRNPNFGNKITNPITLYGIGSANRGKKLPLERVIRMHNRPRESYSHPHSEETKVLIGKLSAAKFTPEFRERQCRKMVELGYWIDPSKKSDYEVYFEQANWVERMIDLLSQQEINLVNTRGMYGVRNTLGVVRDHKYSRKEGFDNRVFPILLRHPANCQILTIAENARKRSKSSITLNELFQAITTYTGIWKEQAECLVAIFKYEQGERWRRSNG